MKPEPMLQTILNFTKIEHTAFSLPLIITGAWLGAGNRLPSIPMLVLIVVAAVGARVFGMAMNRVFDRHIDRLNPRTADRELPAGKMTLTLALAIAFAGLAVYLAGLLDAGWLVPDPVAHSPGAPVGLFPAQTLHPLCHFGIGLCLALAPLGPSWQPSGHPRFSWTAILFSGFVFCWLSGADIIYALMDVDSDRKNHMSTVCRPGWAHSRARVAAGFTCWPGGFWWRWLRPWAADRQAWIALATSAFFLVLMYVPAIPVPKRFFPISTIAGIAGALAPMVA
jgi:4-hydroxybenzoate polyprenyltransferase